MVAVKGMIEREKTLRATVRSQAEQLNAQQEELAKLRASLTAQQRWLWWAVMSWDGA
jgi:hypothetical protein